MTNPVRRSELMVGIQHGRTVLPAESLRTAFHELKVRPDHHRAIHFLNERLGLNLELHAKACRYVDRRFRSQGLGEGNLL